MKNGIIKVSDKVEATVDHNRRSDIQNNHTATHLLQQALRDVLGDHVQQSGSLVAPDYLRFDFSHFKKMTLDDLANVEKIINDVIRQNYKVDPQDDIPIKECRCRY